MQTLLTRFVDLSLYNLPQRTDMEEQKKVIGGGVVGLAIARQLAARQGTSTILLEKHDSVGTETSSRNSEASLIFSR